jgi:hypothetical protein
MSGESERNGLKFSAEKVLKKKDLGGSSRAAAPIFDPVID